MVRPDLELNLAADRELNALEQKLPSAVDPTLAHRERLLPCGASVSGALQKAVDVFNGPDGKGMVLRLIYEQDGKRWIKRIPLGAQVDRSCDWKPVVAPSGKYSYGSRAN